MFRSIFDDHPIFQDSSGWRHLKANASDNWPLPGDDDAGRLLEDALQFNPDRYGRLVSVSGSTVRTDTGVELRNL